MFRIFYYLVPAVCTTYYRIIYNIHLSDIQERQEVRNARVSLVTGLMTLLPRQSYRKTVRWLLKLSTTSRVAHRQIAVVSHNLTFIRIRSKMVIILKQDITYDRHNVYLKQ